MENCGGRVGTGSDRGKGNDRSSNPPPLSYRPPYRTLYCSKGNDRRGIGAGVAGGVRVSGGRGDTLSASARERVLHALEPTTCERDAACPISTGVRGAACPISTG